VVTMADGSTITDELAVADAHPLGARPFARPQYIAKFRTLADGIVAGTEQDRFLESVEKLATLSDLSDLNVTVDSAKLGAPRPTGIFDWK